MKSKISKELDQVAASVAEQISRFRRRDDTNIFLEVATHRVRSALNYYENTIEAITRKSEAKSPSSGTAEFGREESRTRNLRTRPGYGWDCDICHGGFECKTFMTLSIGSYKGRLLLDLCIACTRRLSAVVDARLEDGRIEMNRGKR
jgi:hypothetical protein